MAKGIHLVSVDSRTGNAVVQYDGDTQNNVIVQGAYNGTDTVIIPGWGTFKARTDGRTTFTGEAGLSGELNISIAKAASIVANQESTLGKLILELAAVVFNFLAVEMVLIFMVVQAMTPLLSQIMPMSL